MSDAENHPATADPSGAPVWLSIITPVLNAERFIGPCIENIAGQGVPGVEHIIMDGQSTDGTLDIARRYAERDPLMRIVSEKDGSQAAAMNHGIRLARGAVLGFLNADDAYEPNLLPRIAELFKTLPDPSFALAHCNVRDESGKLLVVNKPAPLTLMNLLKGREYPWNPSAYFYHKSLHDIAGLYDPGEHYVMDLDFILRAVQKANVVQMEEVWGNFLWMEGTKTFEDAKAGRMEARCDAVRRKYWGDLPAVPRAQLIAFRAARAAYHRVKPLLKKLKP